MGMWMWMCVCALCSIDFHTKQKQKQTRLPNAKSKETPIQRQIGKQEETIQFFSRFVDASGKHKLNDDSNEDFFTQKIYISLHIKLMPMPLPLPLLSPFTWYFHLYYMCNIFSILCSCFAILISQHTRELFQKGKLRKSFFFSFPFHSIHSLFNNFSLWNANCIAHQINVMASPSRQPSTQAEETKLLYCFSFDFFFFRSFFFHSLPFTVYRLYGLWQIYRQSHRHRFRQQLFIWYHANVKRRKKNWIDGNKRVNNIEFGWFFCCSLNFERRKKRRWWSNTITMTITITFVDIVSQHSWQFFFLPLCHSLEFTLFWRWSWRGICFAFYFYVYDVSHSDRTQFAFSNIHFKAK